MDNPIIKLVNIHKRYGTLEVLRGIDLTLCAGEKTVIIGPSGCGKSTLLRCINGLEGVDSGEITVNGVPLHKKGINLNGFRANIGMVFQQFNLFPHMTVLENLMLGPVQVKKISKAQAEQTAYTLLKRIGIEEKAKSYPDQLSGGQKQRVAIARSLAMEPPMILLDEPTSALDPIMAQEVLTLIQEVAQENITLVMITHEMSFARQFADRILLMQHGQIQEEGTPDQLFNSPQKESTRRYLQSMVAHHPKSV